MKIEALESKGAFLLLPSIYPLVKNAYETAFQKQGDRQAMEEVGSFAEEVIGLFFSLIGGRSAYIEQIPPSCDRYVEEWIRQAAEKVKKGVFLEEAKVELEGKIGVFIDMYHPIDSASLSSVSKEGAMAEVGEAITKGASLSEVEALFLEYMHSAQVEGRVRNACPGCVMGREEWSRLGAVGKSPLLTEEIVAALHQPSPSDPTKEAWQTGLLVLVPAMVGCSPLTLNRLGELMKEPYFPFTEAGYQFISPDVAAEYGNKPVEKSHWVLIEKDVLPGSRNKSFQEQQAMIQPPYQVPELLPMTAGIILNYLNSHPENKERLFSDNPWTYTRCKETIENDHVVVGGFVSAGLLICRSDYDIDYNGVGAKRKFGSC